MDKIVIDLNDNSINERMRSYGQFSRNVHSLLLDLSRAGFSVPTTIRGTQKQIDAFKNLLIECTHKFELENNETVELDLNKEDYLNWGFRFKDPVDKVSNSIK